MNQNSELPLCENRAVSGFRTLSPDRLDGLNEKLGTCVSPALLSRMAAYCRDTERRDPTAGEIRLADALVRLTADSPDRCGAGEMTTDSAETAAIWADIMAQRRLFYMGVTAPATLADILSLTACRLFRTGERVASDRHLFAGTDALSACLAAGCQPVQRLRDENGGERLLGISLPRAHTPPAQGDLLLTVREVPVRTVFTLLSSASPLRSADVVILGARPLPLVLCDTVPGVCITGERLFPDGEDFAARLASPDTFASHAPAVTLLLRVTAMNLRQTTAALTHENLHPTVFGRVQTNGRLEVTLGGMRVISLSTAFLRGITAPRLCAVHLPSPAPVSAAVSLPAVFTLPSAYAGEEGKAPDGSETVALTSSGPSAVGYGVMSYTAACGLSDCRSAVSSAQAVLLAAVAGSVAQGIRLQEMSLSVSLSGKPPVARGSAMPTADETAFAAACGLYRAAAELRLPMPDPAVSFSNRGNRLSVTAWGAGLSGNRADSLRAASSTRFVLCAPAPAADGGTNWEEIRALLRALADIPADVRLLPLCQNGMTLRDTLSEVAARAHVSVETSPAFRQSADTSFDIAFLAEVPDGIPFPGVEIGRTLPAEAYGTDGMGTEDTAPAFRVARTAVLPLLRKTREADVRALADVLRKQGYTCALFPVSVTMTELELPTSDACDTLPEGGVPAAAEQIPTVTDIAASRLCHRLQQSSLSVFAMSREDAEILLRNPHIADTVTSLSGAIVIGSACRVFAEKGLLPAGLMCDARTVHASETVLTVTAPAAVGTAVLSRLTRTDLLMYSADCPHRIEIQFGDRTVPDAFVGDGGITGFVNGLPDGYRLP